MAPKEKSLFQKIDDINNQRLEEEYNQLDHELAELRKRREINKVRVEEVLQRLDYLRREIDRFKRENP